MIGYSVGEGTTHIFKNSLGRIYVNAYVDGTLTDAEDSFLWSRLNNEPQFQQVANRVWNTNINLIEEF